MIIILMRRMQNFSAYNETEEEKIFPNGLTLREMNKDLLKNKTKKISKYQIKCIEHFSNGTNSCKCCGEDNMLFLTLSHIDGDGWMHKILNRGGSYAYNLCRDNFKTHFNIEIECYNCNLSRERNNGECAHNG